MNPETESGLKEVKATKKKTLLHFQVSLCATHPHTKL